MARVSLKEMWTASSFPGPAAFHETRRGSRGPSHALSRRNGARCFISSSNLAGPEPPCTPWPGQQMTKCRCGSDLLQNPPTSDLTVPDRGATVRGGGGVRAHSGQRVRGGLLNQLWVPGRSMLELLAGAQDPSFVDFHLMDFFGTDFCEIF